MTIDPETLMAYADGELDAVTAKRVERAIAADPALAQEVKQHRALAGRVASSYAGIAAAPVPDYLSAMLQSNVVPLPKRDTRRHWATAAAIAASLVIGIATGRELLPDRQIDGFDVSADLATTLDTQLASTQPVDAATRVGLTFRATDGVLCRSYEQEQAAGIACREGEGWTQRHWISKTRQGTVYRQAGSSAIAEAAQAMMVGAPFNADQEKAAQKAGWTL
jgi:hypothetical protein